MKKLGVSIIGCGNIFGIHADAVKNSKEAQLISVVDVDENKARGAADKYGCGYYTDFNDMLKDTSVDVVHICTPHYLHSKMAIESMKCGKDVLTEKPMAISTEEAQKMIKVSEEYGRKLGICFQNRYNYTSIKIKELIESGQTGRIISAKAFVTWKRTPEYYQMSDWRGTWSKEGGGLLINQAIHTLDLIQWFLGDIDYVKGSAHTNKLQDVIEVEDTAQAYIKFKSGADAIFFATNCYGADSPVQIELVCEKMTLRLEDTLKVVYKDGASKEYKNSSNSSTGKSYWGSSHRDLIEDFYQCIISDSPFPVQGREGIKALQVIEKIHNR